MAREPFLSSPWTHLIIGVGLIMTLTFVGVPYGASYFWNRP